MQNTSKIGFGLLLFAIIEKQPHLATVMELTSNPRISKKAGSISFPLETVDKTVDQCPEDTIDRLLVEELGLSPKQIVYEIVEESFLLIPDDKNIITRYAYGFIRGKDIPCIIPQDSDIMFYRWMPMDQLLMSEHTRIETKPILQHFTDSGLYLKNLDKMCTHQFAPPASAPFPQTESL